MIVGETITITTLPHATNWRRNHSDEHETKATPHKRQKSHHATKEQTNPTPHNKIAMQRTSPN